MRVALITHRLTKGDGQGRVNYEIALAALKAGHHVCLVATQIAPELRTHPLAKVVEIGVSRWPSALIKYQIFALKSALWLARNRHRLDLIHVNGFITWGRADVNTSHFVHRAWLQSPVHTSRLRRDWYGFYQWFFTRVNCALELWAYKRSQVIVAVSEQVKQELIAAGVAASRIRVIANGVDLAEFRPEPLERRTLGLPEGVLLLFVGDIRTPRKNLDTLLRALTLVQDATLVVVGDAKGSPYPELSEALGVAERVMFLGYRTDVPLLMRAVDVFVFPSRYEACSLVLLEAIASGLPVVAAKTTGGAELLTPECSVLVNDADNAPGLAAAITRLVASADARLRMRAAARKVAESRPWSAMAESYLELYRKRSQDCVGHLGDSVKPA
jgi:glycosyltransferase involved in cell wall biosynthesis